MTGLSGAGKTVFITALVHQLLHGGQLPVFEALTSGRIAGAMARAAAERRGAARSTTTICTRSPPNALAGASTTASASCA